MIAPIAAVGDEMAKKKGPNFSPEFRLETAQLVVDQGYSQKEATLTMAKCQIRSELVHLIFSYLTKYSESDPYTFLC